MTLKQQYLGLIILLLIVLRFVWQPTMQWQDGVSQQITMKKQQVLKMEGLLANSEQVDSKDQETNNLVSKARSYIPEIASTESFKLGIQDEVDTLTQKHGLRVRRYSWLPQSNASGAFVQEVLEVRLEGPVAGFIGFQSDIESMEQLIKLQYMNLNFPRARLGKPVWFNGAFQLSVYAEQSS